MEEQQILRMMNKAMDDFNYYRDQEIMWADCYDLVRQQSILSEHLFGKVMERLRSLRAQEHFTLEELKNFLDNK